MNLVIENHTYQYETEKMLRVFFPATKIAVTPVRNEEADYVLTACEPEKNGVLLHVSYSLLGKSAGLEKHVCLSECQFDDTADDLYERRLVQMLYDLLLELTGYMGRLRPAAIL